MSLRPQQQLAQVLQHQVVMLGCTILPVSTLTSTIYNLALGRLTRPQDGAPQGELRTASSLQPHGSALPTAWDLVLTSGRIGILAQTSWVQPQQRRILTPQQASVRLTVGLANI